MSNNDNNDNNDNKDNKEQAAPVNPVVVENIETKESTEHAESEALQESIKREHVRGADSDNSLIMGILSYLGILIIIPFLVSRTNPFVKFHLKQGFVLVCIEIILSVTMQMFRVLFPVFWVLELFVLFLVIVGVVNVVQKKEKELPIVGVYAKNIKI